MTKESASNPSKNSLREEYISRINRVIDYIEENIDQELTLEQLARVATFSQFHFHRIFRAMHGETLNQFIHRVRLEKAASQLQENPQKSITEIAFDCGFSGSSAFARAFKDKFKMSASQWRTTKTDQNSKNGKTNSKDGQTVGKIRKDFDISSHYIRGETQTHIIWRIKMKDKNQVQVEVKEMPELNVAYVRHIGPYQGQGNLFDRLIGKLMKWAGPRGLINFPDSQILSAYHDDPKITEEEKLRTSVCLTIPEDTAVEGEIGKMTIAGGKYAVARFELATDEFEDAWNTIYGGWLPDSGYQPDNRPGLEIYHNDPKDHPENKHVVDICIPVAPM